MSIANLPAESSKPRTITLEPYWPSIVRFYNQMEQTDPQTFQKQMNILGEEEWEKIKAASAATLKKERDLYT